MKCHYCGANAQPANVRFEAEVDGRFVIIENVPAEQCPACGEKTYSPQVVDQILSIVNGQSEPVRTESVPVYRFAESA